MQSCDQVDRAFFAKETPESRDFAEQLTIVRRLGEGYNAIAYQAQAADGRNYALKLEQDVESAAKGMRAVCEFSALPSPVFVRVYGWFILQGQLPPAWMERIGPKLPGALGRLREGRKHRLTARTMCTLMELGTVKLLDAAVLMSLNDARAILFMTLHALYVARRELGKRHGDLHVDNITAVALDPDASVTLRVGETPFRIRGVQYMPKIIDPAPPDSYIASDVSMLAVAMSDMAHAHRLPEFEREIKRWERAPEFIAAERSDPDNVAAYETLLMSFLRYFDVARVLSGISPREIDSQLSKIGPRMLLTPIPVCEICGADARFGLPAGDIVCSRGCARRTLAIGLHRQSV